jgi:hypothetical protein
MVWPIIRKVARFSFASYYGRRIRQSTNERRRSCSLKAKLLLPGFLRPPERRRPRARGHSELRVSPARYVLQVRIEAAPTDVGANRDFSARCERAHSSLAPSSRILKGACDCCEIRNPANRASAGDSPASWKLAFSDDNDKQSEFASTLCREIFRLGLRGKHAVTCETIWQLGRQRQRPLLATESPGIRLLGSNGR